MSTTSTIDTTTTEARAIDICHPYAWTSVGKGDADQFRPGKDGAQPTGRVLDGSSDHGHAEEWAESGTYNGCPAAMIYLFDQGEIEDADGEPLDADSYPWETARARIILSEPEDDEQEAALAEIIAALRA